MSLESERPINFEDVFYDVERLVYTQIEYDDEQTHFYLQVAALVFYVSYFYVSSDGYSYEKDLKSHLEKLAHKYLVNHYDSDGLAKDNQFFKVVSFKNNDSINENYDSWINILLDKNKTPTECNYQYERFFKSVIDEQRVKKYSENTINIMLQDKFASWMGSCNK